MFDLYFKMKFKKKEDLKRMGHLKAKYYDDHNPII